MHENFGGKFRSNGTGIFFAPKTGTGLSCTVDKIPVKFSLSLGRFIQTNGTTNFRVFHSNGKRSRFDLMFFFFFFFFSTQSESSRCRCCREFCQHLILTPFERAFLVNFPEILPISG